MASRKQQLLLDVKMMLDKASLASEAKEIEKLLSNQQMDIDFDSAEFENAVRQVVNKMSREAITVIGEGFNKALASIGKKQIKLENFLELPNDALWMELGKKAGKYFAQGINTTLQKSSPKTKDVKQNSPDAMLRDKFTNLTKQRDALTQRKDKLNNQIRIKNEAESKLRYYGTGSIMDTGGDFKRQAQQLFDDFMQWNNKIQEVEEGAHASGQALQAWVQAANAVSRLSNTIQSPKLGDVQKKRIIDAIGEKKFEYFSNGDFDEDVSIGADQIESFVDTDELQDKKDQIIKQIKQLDIEIDKLTQEHPELISEQSVIDAEDKIKRVEEAYERLKFGRGKHKGELDLEKIHDIELALNYKNGKSGLDALSDKMGNVRFANWEEQAKNALKFAQEYEKRLDNPALNQDELLRHKDTYEKIKPHLAEYRAMLQDVLNLTQGITPHIPDEIVQREEVVNKPTREASDIKAVENAVDKVTVAVNKKTEAFRTEGKVVSDVTQKEIGQLTALEQTLNSAVGVDDVGKLTDYVDNNYLSQGKHMSDFLNDIKNKSLEADAELKKILTSLHLIDENGDITFDIKQSGASGSGTTHNGALIGKDFAIIERSGYAKVANSNLPSATKTVNDAGINVAQILGYIKSKTTEGYFDVQKTVQGDNMFKDGVLSPEVVNATEEQLRQLVDAFIMARQNGFYIENGGSNIVYDAKKGFSFYDLEEMDSDDKDYFKNLNLDDLKLDALEDAISVFSEYNRDYTNAETDPLRGDFFAKFRAAISKHPGFAGINFSDKFDDIYAQHGDVDEQWDEVLKDKKQTLNNQDSSQQINDVTNAVRAKTQAFKEEQVEVDKVVNAEIEALIKLEQVVNRVRDALNKSVENVNILQSNADSIKTADKKDEGETKRVQNLTKLYEKFGEARFTAEHSSDPIERHKASKQKEKLEQILAKKNPTDKKTKERAEAEFQGEQKARIAEMKKLAKLQAEQSKIEAKNEVNETNKTHEERLSYLQRIIAEQKKSLGLSEKEQNVLADIATKTKMNAVSIETDKKAERDAKKADDDRKNKLQAKRNEVGLSKTENIAKQAATVKDQLSDLGLTQSTQAAEILNKELEKLSDYIKDINKASTADGITDKMAKELSSQTARVRQMTSQYKADVEQHLRLSGSNATVIGNGTPFVDSDVARDSLARQVKNFEDGKVKITGYNHELQQLTYEVRNNKNQITSCTVEYDRLSHQLVRLKGTTRQAEGFFQSIGRKAKEIGAYFSGSSLIYKAAQTLREGITYVKEIDVALTELKKVTNETTETYDEFLDTAGKTASKVGSTIKDITSSAADWARLGYSISEAAELAETTQVLMNVSEFTDVSTATDSLISSIQAFKYTAEESMDVVDILNTIGNNYAISTADLATSLTKSSGSLVAANGTLEEAVALTATANTIIQDADVVGTALKTVAMRLRGTSTEVMEEEGVDTYGAVTSKSKLRGKIQGLSGVDILTQTGEYKSTYEILLEISKVWKDISDVDQAALLELIAGKRAGSVMSAILNNPQILADSFESANNAMGSAWKENETYLDSIQGKTDLLTNDLQTLWSDVLDSDIIKGFIDFVRILIQAIDKLGLFGTAFAVLTTGSIVKSKSLTKPFVDIIEILATGSTKLKFFGMDLKNLATSSKKPLDNLRKSLSGVLAKIQEMQASRVADDFNADKINIDQFGKLTNTKALSGQVITANRTSFIDALHKSKVKLPTEKDQDIASALSLNSSLKALTKTQVQATLATLGLDEAQQKAILSSLGFDVAAKGLTGTLGALWSVLWPMLAMAAIALVFAGIAKAIDNAVTTTKELEEELDNLSSKIEETQGKITELNSELETTQERIADLSSQSALTFTEQEELENLKLQNEELKRQLELQEALLKSQEAQRLTVAKDYVNQAWYGEDDAKYYIDSGYKVGEDTGWKGFWNDGVSATTALDHAIKGYEESKKNYDKYTEVLSKWNHEDEDSNKKLLTSHGIWANYNYEDIENFQKTQKQLMDDASNSVNTILGDMSSAITEYGLSYSLGDADINEFLDQYYAYFDKWQLAQGKSSKSSIIGNMFGTTGSAEAKELAKQFKEIATNEILSLDEQQEKIREVIGRVNEENSAYNSLKTTMDKVGITAQEIAEYFTEGAGGVDLSNPDAVVAQYAEARRIMKELSALKDHPNLEQELSALGNGGSVDLINRKQIEVSMLEDAGWGDLEGDYATVFSSTFANEEETIAINVTPILPNGSVLSPEELEEYANNLLTGADDIKKLQIGAQFEGEDAIEQASKAAAEISSLSELYYLSDDLFKKNKDGIFEAQVDAFSELLQGMDEECQKTFMSLAEQVKNGEMEWNQAINQFEIAGLIAGMQAVENQFDELNDITFSGVADEISGFINTTEELSAALEDVASSMDLVDKARDQMNSSGRISIKTALELMQATDRWNEILTITNGTITLNANAEEVLVEAKLNVIKANIDEALTAAQLKVKQLEAAQATLTSAGAADVTDDAYVIYTNAMNSYTASIAAFGAAIDALVNKKGNVIGVFNDTYKASMKTLTPQDAGDVSAQLKAAQEEVKRLQAQKSMLAQGDTWQEYRDNYDYDKKPGDKYSDDDAKDAFQKAMDYWENRIGANQSRFEQIQNEIDLIEEKGKVAGDEYYKEQIKLENERLALLNKQKAAANSFLGSFKEGSDEWWEAANTLNDLESEIDDVTASILELNNAMAENDWYVFEETHNRFEDLIGQLETARDVIAPESEEDWFNDQGEWTEQGVAVLGTYVQEMEIYKNALADVNKQLEELNKPYKGNESYYQKYGLDSEQELYEKRQELLEQQQDYVVAIKDSEQAVKDMYEAQIDAVEEYTEKMIDSYNDYIDVVKAALDAERDLHDFKRSVEEKSSNIGELERRIAALSGSTDAEDIAERRTLEKELYEARQDLDDTYYAHAKDAQADALDKEAEAYEESMTKYIEGLRETLDTATADMTVFLDGVVSVLMLNARTIENQYQNTGFTMDSALTQPWTNAANKVHEYEGDALALMNSWTQSGGMFDVFSGQATNYLESPWESGQQAMKEFQKSVESTMAQVTKTVQSNVATTSQSLSKLTSQIKDTNKQAQNATEDGGYPNKTPASPTQNKNQAKQAAQDYINSHKFREGDRARWGQDPQFLKLLQAYTSLGGSLNDLKAYNLGHTDIDNARLGYWGTGKNDFRAADTLSREIIVGSENFVEDNTIVLDDVAYYRDKQGFHYPIKNIKKVTYDGGRSKGYAFPVGTVRYKLFAKGTMGTQKDQYAITDEPWLGDELTMYATKQGTLSYMRAGSTVIPADLTKELMDLGELGVDGITNMTAPTGVSINANYISKPEINISFDALLKAERITEDSIPAVKKLVNQELEKFAKQLNYSLRKVST